MRRAFVVVEGQTEERVVKDVLAPHLLVRGVSLTPIIVCTRRERSGRKQKGGGDWGKWRRDIVRLLGEQRASDVAFSTLFDLFRLPRGFPGLAEHAAVRDTAQRAALLEEALAAEIADPRLIPYIQRHELESLLFTDLAKFDALLDDPVDKAGLAGLQAEVAGMEPEDIDDGPERAPSRRIAVRIASYRKTVHGPLVIAAIGLDAIRARCPRLDRWVSRLEALGEAGP